MIHRRKFIALTTTSTLLIGSGTISASTLFSKDVHINVKSCYNKPVKILFLGDISKAMHFVNQCEFEENSIEVVGYISNNSPVSNKSFNSLEQFFLSGESADVAFIIGKKIDESVIESLLKADLDVWIDRPATLSVEGQQKLDFIAKTKNKKLLFTYLHNNQLNLEKNTILKEIIHS